MRNRTHTALAATIALTFVTGVVDAVGFLALDRVFTGNMTGNIVILAMGVAGADDLPILGPVVALAAFAAAAWTAGLILRRSRPTDSPNWHDRVTLLLFLGAGALAALTVVAIMAGGKPAPTVGMAMAAATAAVMGSQAVVARHIAIADMTTVVVTSTLASLAGETWTRGGRGLIANRRLGAIAAIFSGALFGVLLLKLHVAIPYGLAAALTATVGWLGHRRLSPRALATTA